MGSPRRAPQAPDVIRRFKVAEGDPSRLLDFLIANLPELKRTRIKQMLRHDQVALDGVPVTDALSPLDPGDQGAGKNTRDFRHLRPRRL